MSKEDDIITYIFQNIHPNGQIERLIRLKAGQLVRPYAINDDENLQVGQWN